MTNLGRFKFRAYDTETNEMIYDDEHLRVYSLVAESATSDRYVLMQSTGLHDKNGTLIFEDDVLQWEKADLLNPEIYVGKVEWFYAGWIVDIRDCAAWSLCSVHDRQCEIIGNQHDSPEPLKGEAQ